MKQNTEHLKVETAPGIIDVYDEDVTSFSVKKSGMVNVKHRIDGNIAVEYDIEV